MKNLNLSCVEDFKDELVFKDHQSSGYWGCEASYQFRFANRYGASVIKKLGSYGYEDDLWELAVLLYGDDDDNDNYDLTYDTPITNDVVGYLTDEEVKNLLIRIKGL